MKLADYVCEGMKRLITCVSTKRVALTDSSQSLPCILTRRHGFAKEGVTGCVDTQQGSARQHPLFVRRIPMMTTQQVRNWNYHPAGIIPTSLFLLFLHCKLCESSVLHFLLRGSASGTLLKAVMLILSNAPVTGTGYLDDCLSSQGKVFLVQVNAVESNRS